MKIYRLEYRSKCGWSYEVDHFKSKREALKRAGVLLACEEGDLPDLLTVTKIITHGATPFEILKSLAERGPEMLTDFYDYSRQFTEEIIFPVREDEGGD